MTRTLLLAFVMWTSCFPGAALADSSLNSRDSIVYTADNALFRYTGRIDFTDKKLPTFWAPGVYISAAFRGTYCEVLINDQELWSNHNYVSIVIDDQAPVRVKLKQKRNVLTFGGLKTGDHRIVICKSTESGQGYLQFAGLRCARLIRIKDPPIRRIEFIGNSITCGTGSDLTIPCDKGEWYDQHNAYMSYGPLTARALNAEWMLSAVSGIGLVRSCCNMDILMPQVFDKLNMRENKETWDFSKYTPDVVTITLGQNDGVQDSTNFCSAYVQFVGEVRMRYPSSTIVCLTSPMADDELIAVMKKYLTGVKSELEKRGDRNVFTYFYSKSFNDGCGNHPDLKQHDQIAVELTAAIRRIKGW
jgi:hypothetical protein